MYSCLRELQAGNLMLGLYFWLQPSCLHFEMYLILEWTFLERNVKKIHNQEGIIHNEIQKPVCHPPPTIAKSLLQLLIRKLEHHKWIIFYWQQSIFPPVFLSTFWIVCCQQNKYATCDPIDNKAQQQDFSQVMSPR